MFAIESIFCDFQRYSSNPQYKKESIEEKNRMNKLTFKFSNHSNIFVSLDYVAKLLVERTSETCEGFTFFGAISASTINRSAPLQ
jgi:hypothetical protein